MAATPKDGQFDVATISKLLMITPQWVQQLSKQGWITKGEHGRYSLVDSVQGYIRYLKEHVRGGPKGNEHSRLVSAQAAKVEMENYRRSGELQLTSHVEEIDRGLIVMMKSAHEGLPGRLANELANQDAPILYQRIQTELRAVLNQCADYLEKRADAFAAMPAPREDAASFGADDTDAMGGEEPHHAPGQS